MKTIHKITCFLLILHDFMWPWEATERQISLLRKGRLSFGDSSLISFSTWELPLQTHCILGSFTAQVQDHSENKNVLLTQLGSKCSEQEWKARQISPLSKCQDSWYHPSVNQRFRKQNPCFLRQRRLRSEWCIVPRAEPIFWTQQV